MKYNDDAVLAFETAFLSVIGVLATVPGFFAGIELVAVYEFLDDGGRQLTFIDYLIIFGFNMTPAVLILLGLCFRWMAVVAHVVIIFMMGRLVPYWWSELAPQYDPTMPVYLGLGIAVPCISVLLIGPAIRRAIKGIGDKKNS